MAFGVPKTSEKGWRLRPWPVMSPGWGQAGILPRHDSSLGVPFSGLHAFPTSCRHLVAPWWQGRSLLLPQILVRGWGPYAAGSLQGGSNGWIQHPRWRERRWSPDPKLPCPIAHCDSYLCSLEQVSPAALAATHTAQCSRAQGARSETRSRKTLGTTRSCPSPGRWQ